MVLRLRANDRTSDETKAGGWWWWWWRWRGMDGMGRTDDGDERRATSAGGDLHLGLEENLELVVHDEGDGDAGHDFDVIGA